MVRLSYCSGQDSQGQETFLPPPLLTSKPATMTQSAQTTIPCNPEKNEKYNWNTDKNKTVTAIFKSQFLITIQLRSHLFRIDFIITTNFFNKIIFPHFLIEIKTYFKP